MKHRSAALIITLSLLVITPYRSRFSFAQQTPKRIDVVAKRFEYSPSEITLKKGEPVIIALRSEDVAHGIHFKELNLQARIDKGGTGQLSFTPQTVGTFVGHCSVFCGSGHGGMILTLHVVE